MPLTKEQAEEMARPVFEKLTDWLVEQNGWPMPFLHVEIDVHCGNAKQASIRSYQSLPKINITPA